MSRVTFVANRIDGLGARLLAFCNAMLLADYFRQDFAFEWIERKGPQETFNSVLDAEDIFSAEFIKRYLHEPVAAADQVFLRQCEEPGLEAALQSGQLPEGTKILVPQVSPCHRYFPATKKAYAAGGIARMFAGIEFSGPLRLAIDAARAAPLPPACRAMHLRAGDVIYGRYRHSPRYVRKAIPLELAEEVIRQSRNEGCNVLVIGQDTALIDYLVQEWRVISAASLTPNAEFSETQRAMFDMVLMSRCREILAGNSGFARLAAAIGNTPRVEPEKIVSQERLPALMLAGLDRPRDPLLSSEQRHFSIRWTLTCQLDRLSDGDIIRLCDAGRANDPTDWLRFVKAVKRRVSEGPDSPGRAPLAIEYQLAKKVF